MQATASTIYNAVWAIGRQAFVLAGSREDIGLLLFNTYAIETSGFIDFVSGMIATGDLVLRVIYK